MSPRSAWSTALEELYDRVDWISPKRFLLSPRPRALVKDRGVAGKQSGRSPDSTGSADEAAGCRQEAVGCAAAKATAEDSWQNDVAALLAQAAELHVRAASQLWIAEQSGINGEAAEDTAIEGVKACLSQLEAGTEGLTQAVAATHAQLLQQLATAGRSSELSPGPPLAAGSRSPPRARASPLRGVLGAPSEATALDGDGHVLRSRSGDLPQSCGIDGTVGSAITLYDPSHVPCLDCASPELGAPGVQYGHARLAAPPPMVRRTAVLVAPPLGATAVPASPAPSPLLAAVVRLRSLGSSPLRRPPRPEEVARSQSPVRLVSQQRLHTQSAMATLPQGTASVGVGSIRVAPPPELVSLQGNCSPQRPMIRATLPRCQRGSPVVSSRACPPPLLPHTPPTPARVVRAAVLQASGPSRTSTPKSMTRTPPVGGGVELRRASSPVRTSSPVRMQSCSAEVVPNQVLPSAAEITARVVGPVEDHLEASEPKVVEHAGQQSPTSPVRPSIEVATETLETQNSSGQSQRVPPADTLPNFGAADARSASSQRHVSPARRVLRPRAVKPPGAPNLVLPPPRIVKRAPPLGPVHGARSSQTDNSQLGGPPPSVRSCLTVASEAHGTMEV